MFPSFGADCAKTLRQEPELDYIQHCECQPGAFEAVVLANRLSLNFLNGSSTLKLILLVNLSGIFDTCMCDNIHRQRSYPVVKIQFLLFGL